jgi:hypothetical protein
MNFVLMLKSFNLAKNPEKMNSKRLASPTYFSITLLALLTLKWFDSTPAVAEYSPVVLKSVYPLSINEWTQQDKIDAFEYVNLTGDCSFKGIKLQGKVKFVTSFPDIKIQYVTSFPDIKVKFVSSFPDACGKWQVVESFPDFKVQIVESFPDLKVQIVESFPGMR